jgi:hypothetical protein
MKYESGDQGAINFLQGGSIDIPFRIRTGEISDAKNNSRHRQEKNDQEADGKTHLSLKLILFRTSILPLGSAPLTRITSWLGCRLLAMIAVVRTFAVLALDNASRTLEPIDAFIQVVIERNY